jgi:hypothetical protein
MILTPSGWTTTGINEFPEYFLSIQFRANHFRGSEAPDAQDRTSGVLNGQKLSKRWRRPNNVRTQKLHLQTFPPTSQQTREYPDSQAAESLYSPELNFPYTFVCAR